MASFTDQQLLDQARNALGGLISGGQSYTINGRSVTKANMKDIWAMIQELETRVAASTGDPGGTGIVLTQFNSAT